MANVAGSPRAQRTRRELEKEREEIRRRDLVEILSTPAGRRFLYDLVDRRCLVYSASYTGNSDTYYREGRRSVGIELITEVQARHPELWTKVLEEQLDFQKRTQINEQAMKVAAELEEEDA